MFIGAAVDVGSGKVEILHRPNVQDLKYTYSATNKGNISVRRYVEAFAWKLVLGGGGQWIQKEIVDLKTAD